MRRSLVLLMIVVMGYAFSVAGVPAQAQERAYAPEDLRTLSRQDQIRVIRKEYTEQSGGRTLPGDQLDFYLDQVSRSNWRFSDIKRDIATSLAGNRPSNSPAAPSVVCSSERYRYRECQTGFRGPAVLAENISSTRCIEGQNWGNRGAVLWVDKGCQGRFVGAVRPGETLICESRFGRHSECRTGFTDRVTLTRQISSTVCIEGRNWGQHTGVIWVRNSCGAEFTRINAGLWPGGQAGYSVTCSSERGQDRTCSWDGRHGIPVLVQQLSSQPCQREVSWKYEAGRIWVGRGCSARFSVKR